MRLTTAAIERTKPTSTRREIPDDLCPGLYLVVQSSGLKSWALRYRRNSDGKTRKLTLGRFPALDLSSARGAAREALSAVQTGSDPAGDKSARKARGEGDDNPLATEAVIARFLSDGCSQHRSQSETARLLNKEVLPHWRGRTIDSIKRADVVDLIWRLKDRGTLVQANRLFARLRRLFNWTVEFGLLETSPMDGLKRPASEQERDRVLDDEELAAIWRACDSIGWPFGQLVQLLILTGQRRDEVAGMRWGEIDLTDRIWRLPAERMKNGDAHDVALSDTAMEILDDLPRINDSVLVFTTNGETPVSGFSRAKSRIDHASGVDGWKLHDLRRTCATGMARLNVPPHVADKVLGHKQGAIKGVARIYNRFEYADERRAALEAWARYVESLIRPIDVNVVELRPVGVEV